MASIRDMRHRGRGIEVRWRDPDGTQRTHSCPTRRAAKALEREVDEAKALGRRWEPRNVCEAPLLREIVESYIRHRARCKAEGTVHHDALSLEVFLRFLGLRKNTPPTVTSVVLSKDLMSEFYEWLSKTPLKNKSKPCGVATREKHLRRVEGAWKWAYNEERYGDFIPRPRPLELPSLPADPVRAPTWEEMDACVLAATTEWVRRVLVVQRYTGLRVGQVMRLLWKDFDLELGTLTFRGVLGKTREEKRGRIIPISPHLVEELSGWGRRDGWLIETRRTGAQKQSIRVRDVCRVWARAGISEEVWAGRPNHAFRKGIVSGLKAFRADVDAIEVLVGHQLPGQRSVYTDPNALPMRDAVALIPKIGAVSVRAPISLDRLRSSRR